ncbi:MAG TPA: choice-of-anchor R domain-containing protein [Patescibacteria group bacterium]|nr:choice-of-anchor R domain-containing protein [Patescibacteria group bacterium]
MNKFFHNQSGYLLLFVLVFTAILMSVLAGLIGYARVNLTAQQQTTHRQQALHIAEAGIEHAIKQLNEDVNYAGETNTPLGEGTFTISVATIDQYTKRVTATGNVPYGNGSEAERTVEATAHIDTATISFSYGVQVGNGGFSMGNNSVVNGNIYANGNVNGFGQVTGDVSVAAGAAAAPDQNWTTQNADSLFGNVNQRTSVAQSFTPSQTDTLTKVSVRLKKIGNPGNLTMRIVTDDSGSPSKTVLVSGSISAALVTTNYAFVDAALGTTPTLTAGQKYWIMLTASVNASNHYSWAIDTGDGFANNTGKYSQQWNAGNPVWNSSGGDYNFQTYLGGIVNTLSGITVNGTARAAVMSSCEVAGNAYFDTSNTCAVAGQQFGGTPAPPPAPYPISAAQIAEWKATAEAGGVISGDYTLTDGQTNSLGPQKIDGDLTITNNSILTVTGPIWVNGNVVLDNNVQVVLSSSLGNAGTAFIADYPADPTQKGRMIIGNNSSIAGNGQLGSYPLFISMYSGVGNAIDLSNNADNTIFFAPSGTLTLSNNTGVKEMTASQINMSNNSVVNYDSGLQNAHFSSGPGGSWMFKSGSYAITR